MAAGRRIKQIPIIRVLLERFPEMDSKQLYTSFFCGEIFVNGERIRDPKASMPVDGTLERRIDRFVGRGGYKLEGALIDLNLDPDGLICLDAGASTGGFTDCLLSRGALNVHAVDVGYNQLAWKIRSDERVIVHERTNLMDLHPGDLIPEPNFAVADLSFRSLRGAASRLLELTRGGNVLALVKPQYENPKEEGFDGIVRTNAARVGVLESLRTDLLKEGVFVLDATASKVTGRKGNAEIFLLLGSEPPQDMDRVSVQISRALNDADSRNTEPSA